MNVDGKWLVFIASILWGIGYFLRKIILDDISPLLLTFFTSILVCIALLAFFRLSPKELVKTFFAYPSYYLGIAFMGVVLGTSLMFYGLRELDLSITTLLEKFQPIFVILFASIFLGEQIPKSKIAFIILAIISSYFIIMKHPNDISFSHISLSGLIATLSAAACWAIVTIIGKHLANEKIPAVYITFHRFFLGAVLLLPSYIFQEYLELHVEWSIRLVLIIFTAAILVTSFGYVLFYHALQTVSASIASLIELVTPIVGIILGIFLLGEEFSLSQGVAITLLLFSLYRICKSKSVQR